MRFIRHDARRCRRLIGEELKTGTDLDRGVAWCHDPDSEADGRGCVMPDEAIADVARIRAMLVAAARRREAMSYSDMLILLGHRFTRPKMRALCRTLDAIDRLAADAGEPDLAVLVVREADGLPGQGWWVGGRPMREGYEGPWIGPKAKAFVAGLQERAFGYWADSSNKTPRPSRTRRMPKIF